MARVLARLAGEAPAILAHCLVYLGTLALLGIAGLYFWNQWLADPAGEPAAKPGWSVATRSYPAFAVSQFDLADKTESYVILRHPQGGRRDIFRWAALGQPMAELEIYRPGGESLEPAAGISEQAANEPEAAGVIGSKFGAVALFRRAGGADDARTCLGFIKAFDEPRLKISGWSCQGETMPAERAAIGCMLSRLILLTAGNDPKLARLFARAELRRGGCAPAAPTARPADWLTATEKPALRGAF